MNQREQMYATEYAPRAGSKVALAAAALKNGPMTSAQLAEVLKVPTKRISSLLSISIGYGFFVKVRDVDSVRHYALSDVPLDDRFTECTGAPGLKRCVGHSADVPTIRSVITPSVTPSAAAIAAANPFRRNVTPDALEAAAG